MKPQYRINFEEEGIEMVSIPLHEYEKLRNFQKDVSSIYEDERKKEYPLSQNRNGFYTNISNLLYNYNF